MSAIPPRSVRSPQVRRALEQLTGRSEPSEPQKPGAGVTAARLAELRMRTARMKIAGRIAAERDATGSPATLPLGSPPGRFGAGSRVRVTRVKHANAAAAERGDLGAGTLGSRLEVGCPARFELDRGESVVTSAVRSLQLLGPRAVQIVTGNSVYRFDREDPSD